MTEFERQVAEALQQHPAMPAAHWGPLAKTLAPCVAAAIQAAAIPRMVRGVDAKFDAYSGGIEAGLAALRGKGA